MVGVGTKGEKNLFSENQSVVFNTSLTELTLKNHHNSTAYHYVRWTESAKELRVCFEKGNENIDDLLTKKLDKAKHEILSGCIMW